MSPPEEVPVGGIMFPVFLFSLAPDLETSAAPLPDQAEHDNMTTGAFNPPSIQSAVINNWPIANIAMNVGDHDLLPLNIISIIKGYDYESVKYIRWETFRVNTSYMTADCQSNWCSNDVLWKQNDVWKLSSDCCWSLWEGWLFPISLFMCLIVKLRRGSGKDRQGMAVKAKGLKA